MDVSDQDPIIIKNKIGHLKNCHNEKWKNKILSQLDLPSLPSTTTNDTVIIKNTTKIANKIKLPNIECFNNKDLKWNIMDCINVTWQLLPKMKDKTTVSKKYTYKLLQEILNEILSIEIKIIIKSNEIKYKDIKCLFLEVSKIASSLKMNIDWNSIYVKLENKLKNESKYNGKQFLIRFLNIIFKTCFIQINIKKYLCIYII